MAPKRARSIDHERVGQRLREARARTGMSLRQVAERISLSASALSQIENGAMQPSVGTLHALALELGLSLDVLLENPVGDRQGQADRTQHAVDNRVVVQKTDRARLELVSGVRLERLTSGQDPLVDFLEITYPPRSSLAAHGRLARSGGRELGVILSGELELKLGNRVHRLRPGDSISLPWDEPHVFVNNGTECVVAVWVIAPDGFHATKLHRGRALNVRATQGSPIEGTGAEEARITERAALGFA